jgi:hypothetical protein
VGEDEGAGAALGAEDDGEEAAGEDDGPRHRRVLESGHAALHRSSRPEPIDHRRGRDAAPHLSAVFRGEGSRQLGREAGSRSRAVRRGRKRGVGAVREVRRTRRRRRRAGGRSSGGRKGEEESDEAWRVL